MKSWTDKVAFNKKYRLQASCKWASDEISKSDRTKKMTIYDIGSADRTSRVVKALRRWMWIVHGLTASVRVTESQESRQQQTFVQKLTFNISQVVPTLSGTQQWERSGIHDPPKDEAEYTILLDALHGPIDADVATVFVELMSGIDYTSEATVYNTVRDFMQANFNEDEEGGKALFQKARKTE